MNTQLNENILGKLKFRFRNIRRFFRIKARNHVFGKMDGIEVAYVINLDRQPDRWKQILREIKHQKISNGKSLVEFCHRLPAIDGKKLKINSVNNKQVNRLYNVKDQYIVDPDPQLLSAIRNRDICINMSPEEIAVALSHINAWQKILDEDRQYALILEDDIFFESAFAGDLNRLWGELPKNDKNRADFDVLYLSYSEVERGAEKVRYSEHLMRPIRGLWWLSGYVVSKKGAKKLLSLLPIIGPVDLWINLHFPELEVFMSNKSNIYQRNDLKSNNSYSILPVLSQIGIQSDKTHLELQQQKGRNPVFVIVQNTDHASIIETALSILGYTCCIDNWGDFSIKIQHLIDKNEPLLFDAYVGLACLSENYKALHLLYPDSVFIVLTEGDVNFNKNQKKQSRGISINNLIAGGITDPRMNLVELYEYFENNSKQLFVASVNDNLNWNTLCNFLQCKIPPFNFPNIKTIGNIPNYQIFPLLEEPISSRNAIYLQHDVTPWIIPMERLSAFGISPTIYRNGMQVGKFAQIFHDSFLEFEKNRWMTLENSFPSNLAEFTADNFALCEPVGFKLILSKQKSSFRNYASASISSQQSYLYGRFEVVMKPVKSEGIITAFFLHRNDPWQELDIEFLGKDTSKILFNVYFNPGGREFGWNYGNRGTPVLFDLGFDAAIDYHKYAIEWEPHEIRWFVDDVLIHIRTVWEPTPIPNQPMKVYSNLWPSLSEELAGVFVDENLPVSAHIKSISIYSLHLA